jgi:hypothetical protein
MSDLLLLHCLSTCALVGLIWTIQLVHYPAKQFIDMKVFAQYEQFHQRQMSFIVIPLMLTELGSGVLLLSEISSPLFIAALTALLGIWLSTFLIQVPLHRRLEEGKDEAVITRLVNSNWIRTALWSIRLLILVQIAR